MNALVNMPSTQASVIDALLGGDESRTKPRGGGLGVGSPEHSCRSRALAATVHFTGWTSFVAVVKRVTHSKLSSFNATSKAFEYSEVPKSER